MSTPDDKDELVELRKLVEQSIEQAQRATNFFFNAAHRSIAGMPSPATELSKQSLSFMESSTKGALEHFKKLFQAHSLREAMEIQTEFLKSQVHTVGEHMTKAAATGLSASMTDNKKNSIS